MVLMMSDSVNWSYEQRKLIPARITGSGSEADEIGVPHSWQQLIIDPESGEYRDDLVGLRGTLTRNPAYALDGGVLPNGAIVYVKVRGWSYKVGVIFDIAASARSLCVESGDGGDGGGDGGNRDDGGRRRYFDSCRPCRYIMSPDLAYPSEGRWVYDGSGHWRDYEHCDRTAYIYFRYPDSMFTRQHPYAWQMLTFFLDEHQYKNGHVLFESCEKFPIYEAGVYAPCEWGEPAPIEMFFRYSAPYCMTNCPFPIWLDPPQICHEVSTFYCWPEVRPECYCESYYKCLDNYRVPYDPKDKFRCLSGGLTPSGGSRLSNPGGGSSSRSSGGGSFRPAGALGPIFESIYDPYVSTSVYEDLESFASSSGGGWWSYGSVSDTLSSTPIHDYSPGSAKFLLLQTDSGGPKTITGLSMGQVDGQEVCIKNTSPMDNIVIQWEGTGSLAANRFANPPSSGSDTILPGGRVVYKYTTHLNRWVKVV